MHLQQQTVCSLGSATQAISDTAGTATTQRYFPYGAQRGGGEVDTPYQYTGQKWEENDALEVYYYKARWYDPALRRFLQPDTIVPEPGNPQSLNRYAYALNSPVRHNDPSGHAVGINGYDYPQANPTAWRPRQPIVIRRSAWGASQRFENDEGIYDPRTNINGWALYSELLPGKALSQILKCIVIHHVGDDQTQDILEIQRRQFQAGYSDIAYHYIVAQDGRIYEGRTIYARGAHVENGNSGRIGVLLLGDFQPGMIIETAGIKLKLPDRDDLKPTQNQIESTVSIIKWLDYRYGIDQVVGHRDLNPTLCPGDNMMPYIPVFNSALRDPLAVSEADQ